MFLKTLYLKFVGAALIVSVSRWLAVLSCGFAVLAIFSNVPYFLDAVTGGTSAPLFFAAMIGLSAILGFLNPGKVLSFLGTDVFKVILAVMALYVANWAWLQMGSTGASPEEMDNTGRRIRQVLNFPAAAFVIYVAGVRTFDKWLLVAIITVPVPIVVHFFVPDLLEVFDSLRASGFYLNANQACEGALLWLVMVQHRLRGPLLLFIYVLVAIAVVVTFSRSGLIGCVLVGGFLLYKRRIPRVSMIIPVLIVVFYSALLVGVEDILSNFVENETQLTAMMERFNFLGSLGEDDSGVDDSSVERKRIVAEAFGMTLEHPIFGYGRETHFMLGLASHNIVIDLWFTYGLPGLALYLYIGWMLYRAGVRQGYGLINPYLMLYIWFSPFNHAHLTAPYWMVFYSYVMLTSIRLDGSEARPARQRKRSTRGRSDFSDFMPSSRKRRRRLRS